MKRTFTTRFRVGLALLSVASTLALGFGWADLDFWLNVLATIERTLVA